jgi:hypothetical protein
MVNEISLDGNVLHLLDDRAPNFNTNNKVSHSSTNGQTVTREETSHHVSAMLTCQGHPKKRS